MGFLAERVDSWQGTDADTVKEELLQIGENLIDIYTGKLSADNIISEFRIILENVGIADEQSFIKWILPSKYRKFELSDSSVWVLMHGNEPGKYMHIHPAKRSPFTTRVRASTLKTVLALEYWQISPETETNELLKKINIVRTGMLCLSPIKTLQSGKGIAQFWSLFRKIRKNKLHA